MNDKERSKKDLVRDYLLDHPEFLSQNPDVLTVMELPHESGEAISLIEKQVQQLRKENQKLSGQLNQLVKVATDNEALMSRLHDLTLELLVIEDLSEFFDRLSEVLLDEFSADIINITLFDGELSAGEKTPLFNINRDDPELQQFQPHLDKGETLCGRLNRNKLDFLFRKRAQWVQSTALVPLPDTGMIAIGSSDPARFYPGMGTLFLDLLARVVTRKLELAKPAKKRRSA